VPAGACSGMASLILSFLSRPSIADTVAFQK